MLRFQKIAPKHTVHLPTTGLRNSKLPKTVWKDEKFWMKQLYIWTKPFNYIRATSMPSTYWATPIKYLDLIPTGKDVIKNLQASYREQGRMMALKQIDLDKSIDYLIKAMKINPNDARLLESLGIAYGVKENFPESIKYFNKALEMNPPNAGMMLANLANTYFKMGDKNTATEYMKKAYRADPGLGYKLSTASKGYF